MQQIFIILVGLFLLSFPIHSQEYVKRIETNLVDDFNRESFLEFGEKGLIIQSRRSDYVDGKEEWVFQKYDTELEKTESSSCLIGKKYNRVYSTQTDDRAFILFIDKKEKFVLGNIGIEDMVYSEVSGELPNKSRITELVVLGDYIYTKAFIKKEPVVYTINWKTGEKSLIPVDIPGYKRKRVSVQNLQVLEEANEVLLYVVAVNSRKKSNMFVLRIDSQGKLLEQFNLTENVETNIIDITSHKLSNNKFIYTGTYSDKKVNRSNGLFFAQATKGDIDFITFYNFLDLEEFLSYLPERVEKKIERKKKRKESNDKELKINYFIADHDIIELGNGYLFVGEAFYPTYRSVPFTTYTIVNNVSRPTTSYRQEFDGYQYTHAVIAKYNKEGELLWDTNFELFQAYKPYRLKRFINISEVSEDGMQLAFSSRNKLVSKFINPEGEISEEQESEEIETGYDGDKSKWAHSNLSYWYDNYFIAYGSQKIKNKEDKTVKKRRKVLFMNKIRY